MQLLLEEFFKKIYRLSDESNLLFKIIVRVVFYFMIIGTFILLIILILMKKYVLILIILWLIILGELAHYIRKLREKTIVKNISKEKSKNRHLLKKRFMY